MKKIMFVIPDLPGGGSERALIQILKGLDRSKYQPLLVLFEKKGLLLDEVPEDIKILELAEDRHYRIAATFRIISKLITLIKREKPNVVFSSINVTNYLSIIAARLCRTKVIAYEVGDPYKEIKKVHKFSSLSLTFLRATYPFASLILSSSSGVRASLIEKFNLKADKIKVFYTPFDINVIEEKSLEPYSHPFFKGDFPVIASMGTLVKDKGFDHLLRAIKRIKENRQIRLIILGEGDESDTLRALAHELGIEDDVWFAGFRKNPWCIIRKSHLFVVSSLRESFCNAVVESMICNVPVISTRCLGPSEIIINNDNGLLVDILDSDAIAAAVLRVLDDSQLASSLALSGRKRAMDFDSSKIIKQLEGIVDSFSEHSRRNGYNGEQKIACW